jgi:hypothetical protein
LDKAIVEIIKPHYFVLSSSREFVSLKKKIFIAGLPEFYCGSNEPSHASQFKWLEYTFKGTVRFALGLEVGTIESIGWSGF